MAKDLTLQNIALSPLSRYRNTRLYEDKDLGQTYFGVWRAPEIIETLPITIHIVKIEELHRPDLIAYRVYGNPTLFWVIAIRNNLLLPLRDMKTGLSLSCPNIGDVTRALGTSFTDNPGTF